MKAFMGALALVASTPAAAVTTITFDEYAPQNGAYLSTLPSDRYASLGVTFLSEDDGSTFGGNSRGDPGFWGLEGTNGAAFQGFNGDSYTQTVSFTSNISFFSIDAAKADLSSDVTLVLQGYLGDVLQSSTNVALGDVNVWSTLSINGTFDRVVYSGLGSFDPDAWVYAYGVDNLNFTTPAVAGVPEPMTWMTMILGMGMIGATMRRHRKQAAPVERPRAA